VRCRLVLQAVLPTGTDCLRTFLLPKNYVEVWRHRKRTWVHNVDAVTALALSPDGAEMYSVSWDRSLKAWRMDTLRCVESVAASHDDAINAVAVSPDGCVFTGSADKTVKAWRRRLGQWKLALVGTMARHEAAVNALALGGAGGQVLYSGASDKTIIVWEGVAGGGGSMAATATLRGHAKAVLCLAAAGDVVCSGSADRTVRVWRRGATTAAGYTCLAVLDGHAAAVKSLAVVSKTGGDRDGSCDECFSAAVVCSAVLRRKDLEGECFLFMKTSKMCLLFLRVRGHLPCRASPGEPGKMSPYSRFRGRSTKFWAEILPPLQRAFLKCGPHNYWQVGPCYQRNIRVLPLPTSRPHYAPSFPRCHATQI
jgi:WD40 repeat protein